MSRKGQMTSFAERIEIGDLWRSGKTDVEIAKELQRPLTTIRKWRRRNQHQGRMGLSSRIGRPKTGALGQFSREIVQAVEEMRQEHSGWGPISILIELKKDARFSGKPLPSRSRIAAYLKEKGLVRKYEPHQELPEPKRRRVERPHQEWEIDAQGEIQVEGLGRVLILNIVDVFSHAKIDSLALQKAVHANTQDHQLALRRAFVKHGLPEQISLDHDSVFYDNQTNSPFPTVFHLWLIALGIQVRFIHKPPPAEHAQIERVHQILTQQAVAGQTFQDIQDLQNCLADRLHFLNWEYPCSSLRGQPPLIACPQAQHTPRPYRLEWEKEMLDMQRVFDYLAQGRWFRQTSQVGTFSLGSQRYNAGVKFANQTIEVTFDPHTCEFICLPENSTHTFRLAAKGLSKEVLMGDLDPLLSIPAYQLALPFSPQAWRELQLCSELTDTT